MTVEEMQTAIEKANIILMYQKVDSNGNAVTVEYAVDRALLILKALAKSKNINFVVTDAERELLLSDIRKLKGLKIDKG